MLNDAWIIVVLIGQISALLLLALTLYFATPILRYWNPASGSALQLELERKTFFVSSAVEYILAFQAVIFVLFLIIVNHYLPRLINGAMCASGILSLNEYGYPALYGKIAALAAYLIFIFLNRLDLAEPAYPLTPTKYFLLPFLFWAALADTVLTVRFFSLINPDVIATCCSISFSAAKISVLSESPVTVSISALLIAYYILLVIYGYWGLKKKIAGLLLFLEFLLLPVSVFILKYHFVKYIYALPSHNCLFDLFFGRYYYIGYLLFGLLFISAMAVIGLFLLNRLKKRFTKDLKNIQQNLRVAAMGGNLLFAIIIHLYWFYWKWIIL
ncbi:MAG TPA: hypothetical protein ENK44_04300 [Caldithrix abyssi]|uniref:Uncharacterized protein n=1 Tax=Caldithrix abyssi TaxID=187145 RepID=A0A7V4TYZ9_CALAY|nr:hypothetical protein [Caldithrix abyssi]